MSVLAQDDYGERIQALRPGVAQAVPIGGASQASTAFGKATTVVRLVATTHCFIRLGEASAATVNDHYLPAGTPEYFRAAPGERVATIRSAADGTLYVSEMA